ncbi:MAG: ankyrin repeat domain-containing protein [Fuerstiella sp.]
MKSKEDIECEISDAIVADDADALSATIASHSLSGTRILDGWLSLASQLGQLNTLGALLQSGAPVGWANSDGETAFSYACSRNQLGAAKLLFEHGANINSVDSSGGTPLDCAVCHADPEFRSWLKSIGAIRNFDYDEWPWPPAQTPGEPPWDQLEPPEDAE